MGREIKFRGIKEHDNSFAYGNLLNEQTIGEVGNNLSHYTYSTVKPETVGQFTGLIDKNGKDIFEGDILDVVTEKSQYTLEVKFDNGSFVGEGLFFIYPLSKWFDSSDFESCEIYSNIHTL